MQERHRVNGAIYITTIETRKKNSKTNSNWHFLSTADLKAAHLPAGYNTYFKYFSFLMITRNFSGNFTYTVL